MLAGWLVLGERVTPALAVAILLLAAGIYVVNQAGGPGVPRRPGAAQPVEPSQSPH